MPFRSPGYDRHFESSSRQEAGSRTEKPTAQGKTVEQPDIRNLRPQPQTTALPELRRDAAALASAADVRTREILGIPIAMTDYEQAMDVMDGMVARRERGYVCAVAVHAVTVAHRDPEMMRALRGATLTVPDGMPVVWAANTLGEDLPQRVYGPELMRR
jgi:N-acetylglucosaminyldiphosphoundecaprenol N-acetyl-beta-D-mannosaminyltransferase